MPSQLTYPGVYIEELPSGVRTVTGVATSITAFIGYTAQGPVDKAVQVFNFGEFTREFGGLHRDSDVSYAIQQFFLNGGSNALVVRVALGAAAASVNLENAAGTVLTATALSPGEWGNFLRIDVDYATTEPDSLFNLTVTRVDAAQVVIEREDFLNLSMSSRSASYAVATVNAGSRLIRLSRPNGLAFDRGWALSGDVSAPALAANETQIVGLIDGFTPFTLTLTAPDGYGDETDVMNGINAAITAATLNARLVAELADATGAADATGTFVRLVSQQVVGNPATDDEHSSVTILAAPVPADDAAAALGLGVANGGRERIGSAVARPAPTGTTTADLSEFTAVPAAQNLTITLEDNAEDGSSSTLATIGPTAFPPGPTTLAALRTALENAIHAGTHPAATGAVVELTGRTLRVRLPETFPRATATLSGVAVLNAPAAGSPLLNLQRYLLGSALNEGGQTAGARGSDGTPPDANAYLGNAAAKTGMNALLDVDLFNLLCIPGTPRLPAPDQIAVIQAAIGLCTAERAFYLIDPPTTETRDTIVAWSASASTERNAAVYYPRILAADPLDNFRIRDMPASGVVAGVMARTDAERGVWKAPAGTEAVLRGTQGLVEVLTDMENGVLNKEGVNALRSFPVYGRVVWGARTRRGADLLTDEYKYIPVRRLALYLEETLYRNTQWVVFEPNDEPLWSQIRLNVGAFMQDLFRRGAFQGSSPDKAFLVKCDNETTTQYDIDRGIVNILVAFAPLKPAEFVVIQIQQKAQVPA